MDRVTVLVTCVGCVTSPSQIESLRVNPEGRRLKIIGTDAVVPCIGQYIVDKFYQTPFGNAVGYVERMLEICLRESVDVVFPASHEEALALARRKIEFQKIGTVLAISSASVLELAFNKKTAYQRLKDSGLPCPDFRVVHSINEFEKAAVELGIAKKKIVMKPVLSRGGRGTRILTKSTFATSILNEKPGSLEANYDETLRALSALDAESFPEIILMEYLPGEIYSVDFLAKDGKALVIVPKLRVLGNPSQTIIGMVKKDTYIEEMTAKISQAFGFDYTVNIEMARSENGVPLPFDFNPRIAASTAFCSAAGANLIYYAVKMALGEKIPHVEVRDRMMMIRYFKEYYTLA